VKATHEFFGLKGGHELMSDLAAHLTWASGDNLVYEALRAHLTWVHARLRIWESASGSDLYGRTRALPRVNQHRLVLAPNLFFTLYQHAPSDEPAVAVLEDLLLVEELLAGGSSRLQKPCWSALGDFLLCPSGSLPFDTSYEAPRADRIVIDTRSPYHAMHAAEQWGAIVAYSEQETARLRESVEDVLAFVGGRSSVAFTTINECVRVAAGLNTPEHPDIAAGASTMSFVGRVSITNVRSDEWDRERWADTFVHEAIHSLIYKLELAVPLYTDMAAALSVRAISPWSGRSLTVRSFVHACFVWYGLVHFWGLDAEGLRNPYYARALKGFTAGCPLENIDENGLASIQPYVVDTIRDLYEKVKSDAGVSATEHSTVRGGTLLELINGRH
jgi:hypothetical protein